MRVRASWRVAAVVGATLLMFVSTQFSLGAQQKKPLGYDVVDAWRSIAGTRLSDDGQWLAYALTAQGDDRGLRVDHRGHLPSGFSSFAMRRPSAALVAGLATACSACVRAGPWGRAANR